MQKLYPILLKQHVGKWSKPVVKVGDVVKRETLIAASSRFGSNIHASIDGVIDKIDDKAITIEADEIQNNQFESIKSTDRIVNIIGRTFYRT